MVSKFVVLTAQRAVAGRGIGALSWTTAAAAATMRSMSAGNAERTSDAVRELHTDIALRLAHACTLPETRRLEKCYGQILLATL